MLPHKQLQLLLRQPLSKNRLNQLSNRNKLLLLPLRLLQDKLKVAESLSLLLLRALLVKAELTLAKLEAPALTVGS